MGEWGNGVGGQYRSIVECPVSLNWLFLVRVVCTLLFIVRLLQDPETVMVEPVWT